MKVLLGLLIVVNAGLLVWGMSQNGLTSGSDAPAQLINPGLMEILPPIEPEKRKTALINPAEMPHVSPTGSDTVAVITPLDDEQPGKPAEEESNEPFCLMLGPYDSDDERVRVSRQLDQMTVAFTSRDIPKGRITGYRVYQGPFSTDKIVERARNDLGRKGVTDLFLLREGEDQYISLGFFSAQESADNFVKKFTARGIQVKQRVDFATTYWLVIDNEETAIKLKKSRFPGYPQDQEKARKDCS